MDKDKIKKVIIVVIFTIVVTFAVFITTAELRFTEDTQDSFGVDETSSGFFNILQLADVFSIQMMKILQTAIIRHLQEGRQIRDLLGIQLNQTLRRNL